MIKKSAIVVVLCFVLIGAVLTASCSCGKEITTTTVTATLPATTITTTNTVTVTATPTTTVITSILPTTTTTTTVTATATVTITPTTTTTTTTPIATTTVTATTTTTTTTPVARMLTAIYQKSAAGIIPTNTPPTVKYRQEDGKNVGLVFGKELQNASSKTVKFTMEFYYGEGETKTQVSAEMVAQTSVIEMAPGGILTIETTIPFPPTANKTVLTYFIVPV